VARSNRRRPRARRPDDSQPGSVGPDAAASGAGEELPEALQHSDPDVELAEAQLALGRPDLAEVPDAGELEAFEEGDARHAPARRAAAHEGGDSLPQRAVGFIRGCWSELGRVQWPDRRQVFQATGVVLGFVIVAGAFLGAADLVASKLVNLILTGHA
jgi:preprotein translocase subunit SecE